MNYEKEYKKLKADIEKAYLFAQTDSTKAVLEHILPELAGYKDEQVRKGLVIAVSATSKGNKLFGTDVTREEALAWLEKQGKKKTIWHNEDKEPQRGSLILLIMQSGTPIVAIIIEPNHTFNHGEKWAYIDDLIEKQGGQKPAWSKEDKRMMDLIISIFEVNHPKSIFKDGFRAVYTDEIVSWLKSIEDRMKGE